MGNKDVPSMKNWVLICIQEKETKRDVIGMTVIQKKAREMFEETNSTFIMWGGRIHATTDGLESLEGYHLALNMW